MRAYEEEGEPRADEARPEPRLQPRRREVFTSKNDKARRERRENAGGSAGGGKRRGGRARGVKRGGGRERGRGVNGALASGQCGGFGVCRGGTRGRVRSGGGQRAEAGACSTGRGQLRRPEVGSRCCCYTLVFPRGARALFGDG